jgi:predicted secreted acid phosphatase
MKPKAIIVDLDGTLVMNDKRALKFMDKHGKGVSADHWSKFFVDSCRYDVPNQWCVEIVNAFAAQGFQILFVTGRGGSPLIEGVTREWLSMYVSPAVRWELHMRGEHDKRENHVIKKELMSKLMIQYNISFAIDDMKNNVDMFRSLGIPALHCADRAD